MLERLRQRFSDAVAAARADVTADRRTAALPTPADVAAKLAAAEAAAARRDHDAALALWGELAQAGNARAQCAVAACFLDARGVEKDVALAMQWLTLAAGQGDPEGQRRLAEIHFKGENGATDQAAAKRWYTLAAEQGDAPAQDMLSWMLSEDGEAPDYTAARGWAEKAAAQGNGASMTRLGLFYHNALGVPRDPVLAAMWWEKAAYTGDGDGQAMLGAAYHLGSGRARDPVTALMWLKRARANYASFADRFYEAVWASCTPEQRAEAERRAEAPLASAAAASAPPAGGGRA